MDKKTFPKPLDVNTFAKDPSMEDELAILAKQANADRAPPIPTATMPLPTPPVDRLLDTRQQTHGDFRTNARLSQKLKEIFRSYEGWDHLDDVEKEVLDMISLKLSRVLSGRSLERQHWEDIEGYARLALRECK